MILDEIIAHKKKEIEALKRIPGLAAPPKEHPNGRRDFAAAIKSLGEVRLIAEIKRRSPSRGDLRPGLNPALLAGAYQDAGAAAISVLTDEHFFGGSLMDLRRARAACTLPVLRKDFVLDQVQIWQLVIENGPDAVLLIAAALTAEKLSALMAEANRYGVRSLVEVHNEAELEVALECGAEMIGINNRDLKSFEVKLETTERLRKLIPTGKIVVSESGIHGREDMKRMQGLGVDAVLVGEALMKSPEPAAKVGELLGVGV